MGGWSVLFALIYRRTVLTDPATRVMAQAEVEQTLALTARGNLAVSPP